MDQENPLDNDYLSDLNRYYETHSTDRNRHNSFRTDLTFNHHWTVDVTVFDIHVETRRHHTDRNVGYHTGVNRHVVDLVGGPDGNGLSDGLELALNLGSRYTLNPQDDMVVEDILCCTYNLEPYFFPVTISEVVGLVKTEEFDIRSSESVIKLVVVTTFRLTELSSELVVLVSSLFLESVSGSEWFTSELSSSTS